MAYSNLGLYIWCEGNLSKHIILEAIIIQVRVKMKAKSVEE